jgi:hypothetical protein
VVHPFTREAQTMRPACSDVFSGGQIGALRFLRTTGAVSGFRLTGVRTRNVYFEQGKSRP